MRDNNEPHSFGSINRGSTPTQREKKEGEAKRINKGKERTARTEERKTDQRRKENRESHKQERECEG
jgi:hypothetical protein